MSWSKLMFVETPCRRGYVKERNKDEKTTKSMKRKEAREIWLNK